MKKSTIVLTLGMTSLALLSKSGVAQTNTSGFDPTLLAQALDPLPLPEPAVSPQPAIELSALNAINALREQNGLGDLALDNNLADAARYEILDEVVNNYGGNNFLLPSGQRLNFVQGAADFGADTTGLTNSQFTNANYIIGTNNWNKMVANWAALNLTMSTVLTDGSYTRVGIGVVDTGVSANAFGQTFPILRWSLLAGK